MRRLFVGIAAMVLVGVGTPAASAPKPAPPPPVAPSGAIYAYDSYYPGEGSVAVSAATGGLVSSCSGDPTHATPRRFLDLRDGALVVRDESCVEETVVSDAQLYVVAAKWSFDDSAVAFLTRDGLYVAPAGAIYDERLVVSLPNGGTFDWSPSGDRLVVAQPNPAHKRVPSDPDAFAPPDLYVVSLDGTMANLTNTSEPEHGAAWSPDGGRLAFFRQTVFKGNVRTDLFTMPSTGGAQRQVTNKNNTPAGVNRYPVWSSDSAHLAFSCAAFSGAGSHVCRIDAAGTTKAVDLTPKSGANFVTRAWR